MNLGIDFGSTYSMLSYYDNISKILKSVAPEGNSPHIPSVACRKAKFKPGDAFSYGYAAKTKLDKDKKNALTPYRAFKMLLPVTDQKELNKQGYLNGVTPRMVSKEFLRSQLQSVNSKYDVEQVTICIPYVWDQDYSTLSGKGILYEICQELQDEGLMKSFRVVSEPAAATACVAHQTFLRTKKLYQGWILIIDYGGGTLDITLSNVRTVNRNRKDYMEISVEGQAGAGENHPDNRIGDAGIAYMNAVVAQALKDAGCEYERDTEFQDAVDLLEVALITENEELLDKVEMASSNPSALKHDKGVFTTFSYGDMDEVPVTYSTLVRVYDSLIRPLLDQELKKIFNKKMRPLLGMKTPKDAVNNLQIALVGGFGQFILVRQQVCECFNIGDSDEIGVSKEDAISYGAALIANGNVALQVRAPASIGICFPDKSFDFAFVRHAPLEPGQIQFLDHTVFYLGAKGKENFPWQFVLNLDGNPKCGRVLVPIDDEVREKMLRIPSPCSFKCGFSVNESEVITFWYVETDTYGKYDPAKLQKKELGNLPGIFGSVINMEAAPLVEKK